MEITDARLVEYLQSAVGETVLRFVAKPVDFLYESDIQSLLFAILRHEMRDVRYKSKAKDVEVFFKSTDINPVKTEYPVNLEGNRGRFDIAVLSSDHDPNFRIWWQPCRIAVEITLWQPDGTGAGPWDDVKKLQTYWQASQARGLPFTGIAMLFVHPGAEKWLTNISGMEDGACFPHDGIACHVVSSKGWCEVAIPS